MKISTKGDYATRALQDLAMHCDKRPVPIEVIAQRQALPARYLEQLLLTLKRAGFLASKRGVNAGENQSAGHVSDLIGPGQAREHGAAGFQRP